VTHSLDIRALARRRILAALDEVVAQFTVQADLFQRRDAAASILITGEVVGWVSSIALALTRYSEGEYEDAAALADITGLEEPSVVKVSAGG